MILRLLALKAPTNTLGATRVFERCMRSFHFFLIIVLTPSAHPLELKLISTQICNSLIEWCIFSSTLVSNFSMSIF